MGVSDKKIMNRQTAQKLIQLNNDFYQKISDDFSESRNHFWPGWDLLKPEFGDQILKKTNSLIVDLGCGNGRFAQFLQTEFADHNWQYLGLDNNQKLLEIAEKQSQANSHISFKLFDLFDWLFENLKTFENPTTNLIEKSAQIIACFGVTHHLPTQTLRQNFLKILAEQIPKNGLICISFWQFANENRFQNKIISPTKANMTAQINPQELEKNDYILDWSRGQKAFRYCHHWTDEEIAECVQKSGLKSINHFKSDSKSGSANYYLSLQKIEN